MQSKKQTYQHQASESLSQVGEYSDWIISKFEKYLGKNILEVGSGSGDVALKLKERGFSILPTEIDPYFLKSLKRIDKRACYLNILDIKNSPIKKHTFDTIIATNVIEHIADDVRAFKNIRGLLSPQGTFIILVPAHNLLFGSYDRWAGHYRRYSKTDLEKKLFNAGFAVKEINYYNKLSAFGWFINARILKRKDFSKFQLYALKILIPLIDLIDKIVPFDFGLSIICVAKKGDV